MSAVIYVREIYIYTVMITECFCNIIPFCLCVCVCCGVVYLQSVLIYLLNLVLTLVHM